MKRRTRPQQTVLLVGNEYTEPIDFITNRKKLESHNYIVFLKTTDDILFDLDNILDGINRVAFLPGWSKCKITGDIMSKCVEKQKIILSLNMMRIK